MSANYTRTEPHKGNVVVRRYGKTKRGHDFVNMQIVPAVFSDQGWEWIHQFNKGRDWASTYNYPPPVSKGAAFWSGYKWRVGGRKAEQFCDDNASKIMTCNWLLVQDEDVIAGTLNRDVPLRPRQYRYFTGFASSKEITALFVQVGNGEVFEIWATGSCRGDSDLAGATFEPLPVRY